VPALGNTATKLPDENSWLLTGDPGVSNVTECVMPLSFVHVTLEFLAMVIVAGM